MLSFDDCCAFCGLDEQTVLAIAEHEHLPALSAAGFAQDLLCRPDGVRIIGAMIADDVGCAIIRGDRCHAERLRALLRDFCAANPAALTSVRARACLATLAQRS